MSKPRSKMHERLLDAAAHREAARRRHVVQDGGERIAPARPELERQIASERKRTMSDAERAVRAARHERLRASFPRSAEVDGRVAQTRATVAAAAQKKRELDEAAAARGEKRELVVSAAFADRIRRAGGVIPDGIRVVDPLLEVARGAAGPGARATGRHDWKKK